MFNFSSGGLDFGSGSGSDDGRRVVQHLFCK